MSTRWTKWTLNAIAAILLLAGTANATSLCSITGVILDGAGNPVPNATIYFNSQNTQVVNGITIYPILKNSTTDANGNLSSTALQQGLFVQITICQAQGGGCAAPITGFVPVTGTTTFQNLLSGTLVSIGSSLSGNLNASGYRILNLGANTTTGDALSQGVSHLGDLATNNANYNFGGYKFQNLARRDRQRRFDGVRVEPPERPCNGDCQLLDGDEQADQCCDGDNRRRRAE